MVFDKKLYLKTWKAAHPDYMKNYLRRYRAAHPERCRAYTRKYEAKMRSLKPLVHRELKTKAPGYKSAKARRDYLRHRDAYIQRVRNWRIANRERWLLIHLVQQNRRRALKQDAVGDHSVEQWLARVNFFGWRCWMCKKILIATTLTEDHVIPLSKGGTNWPSNLRPACHSCNASKNDKKGGVLFALVRAVPKKI